MVEFVATSGHALSGYERFRRLTVTAGSRLECANPRAALAYRMNVGTIVEAQTLKVRVAVAGLARWRSISPKCCAPATVSFSPANC